MEKLIACPLCEVSKKLVVIKNVAKTAKRDTFILGHFGVSILQVKINKYQVFVLIAGTLLILIPLFTRPDLLLSRGNDLQEFFWPIIEYSRDYILKFRSIPLWNPLWFGGMPLIADPQAPIWYPLNVIFLFFDMKTGFIVGITLHVLLASVFMYKLARKLSFTTSASVVVALSYVYLPRLSASIEAGHWGLILLWTWIPFYILQVINVKNTSDKKYICLLSTTTGLMILSHALSAIIIIANISLLSVIVSSKKKQLVFKLLFSTILGIMIISPVFLPQIIWQSSTTRYLLFTKPETFPIWINKKEFFDAIINIPSKFDTEKILTLGLFPLIISLVGFFFLFKKKKMVLIIIGLILILICMNNVSPINQFVTQNRFFSILRVNTRMWILIVSAIPLCIGAFLSKIKYKTLFVLISALILVSLLSLSLQILSTKRKSEFRINKEFTTNLDSNENFRVFCPDRCVSQRDAYDNGFETIDGYATLIPKTFYVKSWGLFGGYWDYYTLSLPPFGIESIQQLKPDYAALGEYNTEFIILRQKVTNNNLVLIRSNNNYYLYLNKLARGHIYSQDETRIFYQKLPYILKSNSLVIDTSNLMYTDIVIAQTFTKGFFATDDMGANLNVYENPSSLLQITIQKPTKSVTVSYNPPGFKEGMVLFLISIIILAITLII